MSYSSEINLSFSSALAPTMPSDWGKGAINYYSATNNNLGRAKIIRSFSCITSANSGDCPGVLVVNAIFFQAKNNSFLATSNQVQILSSSTTLTTVLLDFELVKKRAMNLLRRAMSSPTIKKLYDQASQSCGIRPTVIFCLDPHEVLIPGSEASTFTITLSSSFYDDDALDQFVFKLMMVAFFRQIKVITDFAISGLMENESYVRAKAYIEHEIIVLYQQAMQTVISELSCGAAFKNRFAKCSALSFEEYCRKFNSYSLVEYCMKAEREIQGLQKKDEKDNLVLKQETDKKDPMVSMTSNQDNIDRPSPRRTAIPLEIHAKCKRMIRRARSSCFINELFDKASQMPYDLRLGYPRIFFSSDPKKKFKSYTDAFNRKITLSTSLSEDDLLAAFVYELINFSSFPTFQRVVEELKLGLISCENYIKEMAQIAFRSRIIHHLTMQKIIEEKRWSRSLDKFSYIVHQTFESFLKEYRSSPSAQDCRKVWEENEAYRKKDEKR